VRDQDPLREGNCGLPAGFEFEDLIGLLNEHVFFWPGTAEGPIPAGRNHFGRYAEEVGAHVLRVRTSSMFAANPRPLFCRYNSGAPRCNPRVGRSPRGRDTFVSAELFNGGPSNVVECVFRGAVSLPEDVEYRSLGEYGY
jgi:hypothetical protein